MTTLEEFLNYCDSVSCSEDEYENYIRENMSDFVQFYDNSWKELFSAVMDVQYAIKSLNLDGFVKEGKLTELKIAHAIGKELTPKLADIAAKQLDLEILLWLKENNIYPTMLFLKELVKRDLPDIQLLQILKNNNLIRLPTQFANEVVKLGKKNILERIGLTATIEERPLIVPASEVTLVSRNKNEDDDDDEDSENDEGDVTYFLTKDNKFKTVQKLVNASIPESMLNNIDDPLDEYLEEIMNYLIQQEQNQTQTTRIQSNDIQNNMILKLSDWLVDVMVKFKLSKETWNIAQYMMKYCLCDPDFKDLKRDKLQLLGATCMLISGKSEEVFSPDIGDYIYLCDKAYTRSEFIAMEKRVLETLQFHINFVTPILFLRVQSRFIGNSSKTHTLASYLAQVAVQSTDMKIFYLPSEISAAAIYLAKHSMNETIDWDDKLMRVTKARAITISYSILGLVEKLDQMDLKASKRMYSAAKFYKVSSVKLQQI